MRRSIRLYLRCGSVYALRQLREFVASGQLKCRVEEIFNLLLEGSGKEAVVVKLVHMADYCAWKHYLAKGL